MKIVAQSREHAEEMDSRILAHLVATYGAKGSRWSPIYTDGERFAIAHAPDVEPALTSDELAAITGEGSWQEETNEAV